MANLHRVTSSLNILSSPTVPHQATTPLLRSRATANLPHHKAVTTVAPLLPSLQLEDTSNPHTANRRRASRAMANLLRTGTPLLQHSHRRTAGQATVPRQAHTAHHHRRRPAMFQAKPHQATSGVKQTPSAKR